MSIRLEARTKQDHVPHVVTADSMEEAKATAAQLAANDGVPRAWLFRRVFGREEGEWVNSNGAPQVVHRPTDEQLASAYVEACERLGVSGDIFDRGDDINSDGFFV